MSVLQHLRLANATNPLGLELGERVRVRRTVAVKYNDKGQKILHFNFVEPHTMTVVGSVKKALGTYEAGAPVGDFNYANEYEQGRLKVLKYVRLYEVKSQLTDKPVLAHPDDIEIIAQPERGANGR